jgi:hypothetical protein
MKRGRRHGTPERPIGFMRRINALVRCVSAAVCDTDVALLAQIEAFGVLEAIFYKHF